MVRWKSLRRMCLKEGEGKGKGRMLSSADLGKMLEVTEDLGIWAEFIRRRLE